MKLRIIWIDDSTTWVRSVRDDIEDAFKKEGFTLEILEYQNTDEAYVAIFDSYVDLILVDCNLPGQDNGDQFITRLRKNRCFAHIVYYSQDVKNLGTVKADKYFQHTSPRDYITDTLEAVSEQLYRKYHHPAFMRGMLLSEFIDLENLMEELIASFFKNEADFFKENIIYKGGESYSFKTKQKFISRMLDHEKIKGTDKEGQVTKIGFKSSQFDDKILNSRNVLAHAFPTYDEVSGTIKLMSSIKEVEFTNDWFNQTREDIHLFKKKIRDVSNLNLHEVIIP
ncbi:MAG: response regulator [Methylotenera sp.]